jgi:hypothetical protein
VDFYRQQPVTGAGTAYAWIITLIFLNNPTLLILAGAARDNIGSNEGAHQGAQTADTAWYRCESSHSYLIKIYRITILM